MKKYSMERHAIAMALFNTAGSRSLNIAIHPKTRTFSSRSNQATNGTLDFQGTDDTDGAELLKRESATAGSTLVQNINPGPSSTNQPVIVKGLWFLG